ncbi:hypothetical protein SteCoe_27791 [Stentor coeruleus]|uniref:Kelch motif family protein n=1 Tax=Stentor coeruleus TaxID=5963 RepID=A0A1R2B9M0_9CILI|nr:hypothetical protein SteCoe_27791 [Stentor coeruleus]
MGCIHLKSNKKPKNIPAIKNIETCPEESPDKPPLKPVQIFSPQLSRTPSSIKVLEEDQKIYTFEFLEKQTVLIEYNTSNQALKKTELGISLYEESGFAWLLSEKFFLAGGIDSGSHQEVKSVFIIDPVLKEIFEACQMPFAKRNLRLVQLNDYIYAIGGVKELKTRKNNTFIYKQDYSNSFSRYSLNNNTWETLPDMVIQVENPGCYIWQGNIWVTGGYFIHNYHEITNQVQVFNLCDMVWETAQFSLNDKLFGHVCVVVNEEVLVFGGIKENDELNEDCWKIGYIKDQNMKNICEKQILEKEFVVNKLISKMPSGYDTFFPMISWTGKNEIFCFNEDNILFVFSLQMNTWTVYNLF